MSEYDKIAGQIRRTAQANGMAGIEAKNSNTLTQTLGGPQMVQGFGNLAPKPQVGDKKFVGTETFTMGKNGVITATKTGVEKQYKAAEWEARMEKVANNTTKVDDGSTSRKKSRAYRAGTANVKQASAFGSRRPKTGSLRIDVAGAQVSGGTKIV